MFGRQARLRSGRRPPRQVVVELRETCIPVLPAGCQPSALLRAEVAPSFASPRLLSHVPVICATILLLQTSNRNFTEPRSSAKLST